MKSMTGYGKANVQTAEFALDVAVRSVNGRYLEVKVHGPKSLQFLENEIRKKVSESLVRGTVDIYINKKSFVAREEIHFNTELAKKWLNGFNKVLKDLKIDPAIDPQMLLSISDFVKIEEPKEISSKEKKVLLQTIDKAVLSCFQVRSKEGEGLKKDLLQHLKNLNKALDQIKKIRDKTTNELHKKYEDRLKKINSSLEFDEQRLVQEVVILLEKMDISEEIQRLSAHIQAIEILIGQPGSLGKKLDFYAQELLREVNTIGSKSPSSELTQIVVNAKGLVEKYREQVQNVE